MTTGPSASIANTAVDSILSGVYLQWHSGEPGAAGTNNAPSTQRVAITAPAASGGAATQTGTATLTNWAGGTVNLSHGSYWSAPAGGTYRGSFPFAVTRSVVNGDNLTASALSVSAPISS